MKESLEQFAKERKKKKKKKKKSGPTKLRLRLVCEMIISFKKK
jgi:hypothetical protein